MSTAAANALVVLTIVGVAALVWAVIAGVAAAGRWWNNKPMRLRVPAEKTRHRPTQSEQEHSFAGLWKALAKGDRLDRKHELRKRDPQAVADIEKTIELSYLPISHYIKTSPAHQRVLAQVRAQAEAPAPTEYEVELGEWAARERVAGVREIETGVTDQCGESEEPYLVPHDTPLFKRLNKRRWELIDALSDLSLLRRQRPAGMQEEFERLDIRVKKSVEHLPVDEAIKALRKP